MLEIMSLAEEADYYRISDLGLKKRAGCTWLHRLLVELFHSYSCFSAVEQSMIND